MSSTRPNAHFQLQIDDFYKREKQFNESIKQAIGKNARVVVLPPVPSQKLLATKHLNRSILPILNEATLKRRPVVDQSHGRAFFPAVDAQGVVAVIMVENLNGLKEETSATIDMLGTLIALELQNTRLEKKINTDPRSGLVPYPSFLSKMSSFIENCLRGIASEKHSRNSSPFYAGVRSFVAGIVRLFPEKNNPIYVWDNRWKTLENLGRIIAHQLPDGCLGSLLPQGVFGFLFPNMDTDCAHRWMQTFLSTQTANGESPLIPHGALAEFPDNCQDILRRERKKSEIDLSSLRDEIFLMLQKILDTTITTPHKFVWIWNELELLAIEARSFYFDPLNLREQLSDVQEASALAMRYRRKSASRGQTCRRTDLEELIKKHIPPVSAREWYGNDVMVILLPHKNQKDTEQLAEKILNSVENEMGKGLNIGMSFYPLLDTRPEDVVRNALKALLHADLVGEHGLVTVNSVTFNLSGDTLFNRGRLKLARREYERGLKLDTENITLLNSLGVCYGELGDLDKAEACFVKVLDKNPDDYMGNFNLGCLEIRRGNFQKAEEALFQAVKLNPTSPEVHYYLGKIKQEKGETSEGLFHLKKAASLRTDWKAPKKLIAACYETLGNRKQAIEHYKQVLRLEATDASSLNSLGKLYGEDERDLEVAISLCEKAVSLEPRNPEFQLNLARLLLKAGDLDGAKKCLERAITDGLKREQAAELKKEINKATSTDEKTKRNPR